MNRAAITGRGWTTIAAGTALGFAAFYVLRAQLAERREQREASVHPDPYLTESITINKPIELVYDA